VNVIDLSVTQIRSIEQTWQTVISHVFHIKGADVRNVYNYVTDVPLDCILLNRRMRFISGLCYVNNSSLQLIFRPNVTAKQELIQVIGLMGLGRSEIGLLGKLWCDICKHCINCR